jgi:hypothetical protein
LHDEPLRGQAGHQVEQHGGRAQAGQVLAAAEQGVVAEMRSQGGYPQTRRQQVALRPGLPAGDPDADRGGPDRAEYGGQRQAACQRRDTHRPGVMVLHVLDGLDHADDAEDQVKPLIRLPYRPGPQVAVDQQAKDAHADDEFEQPLAVHGCRPSRRPMSAR